MTYQVLALTYLFISVATTALAFPTTGGAGGVGDGGHGIECQNNDSHTVQLLDFMEARLITNAEPDLAIPNVNRRQTNHSSDKVKDQIRVFEKALLSRASAVLGSSHPFVRSFRIPWYNMVWPTNLYFRLYDMNDIGESNIVVRPDCHLVLLASIDSSDPLSLIRINWADWRYLNDADRLGLLAHENLHRWFGHSVNSVVVRNALIYLTAPLSFRRTHAGEFKRLINMKTEHDFIPEFK